MKILITGITGMAGSHLAEYLVNQNRASLTCSNIGETESEEKINKIRCRYVSIAKCITFSDPISICL